MRPARPARPRLVSGSCSSARSFAPRFLPTLGRPHAVALRFTRRDQLVTGLSPAGTRPCRTHLAALAFRELRSDSRPEHEVRSGRCAPAGPEGSALGATNAPARGAAPAPLPRQWLTATKCDGGRTATRYDCGPFAGPNAHRRAWRSVFASRTVQFSSATLCPARGVDSRRSNVRPAFESRVDAKSTRVPRSTSLSPIEPPVASLLAARPAASREAVPGGVPGRVGAAESGAFEAGVRAAHASFI